MPLLVLQFGHSSWKRLLTRCNSLFPRVCGGVPAKQVPRFSVWWTEKVIPEAIQLYQALLITFSQRVTYYVVNNNPSEHILIAGIHLVTIYCKLLSTSVSCYGRKYWSPSYQYLVKISDTVYSICTCYIMQPDMSKIVK